MALTLTGEIDDSQRDVAITGTVPDAIEPGYLFRFSDGDEVMRLVGFARVKATHGWPVNPNGWIVNRGQLNTEATAHDADSTVQAIVDEFVASEDEDAPDPIDSGGGPGATPTLAEVLAQGNDTGGLAIVQDDGAFSDPMTIQLLTTDGNTALTLEARGSGAANNSVTVQAVNSGGGATVTVSSSDNTSTAAISVIAGFGAGEIDIAAGIVNIDTTQLGFFGTGPITRPEVEAVVTPQDIVDALVALGLITQAS